MSTPAQSNDCVKVSIRVRPMVSQEIARGCAEIVEKTKNEPQLQILGATGNSSKNSDNYTFSNVFMPEDSQKRVYDESVEPIIGKLFEGYNVTIIAYGQTGSGKTFTMGTAFDGDFENPGIGVIPRAIDDIFKTVESMLDEYNVTVSCSFMELYQENLYDLLSSKPREHTICDIREDGVRGILINGLSDIPVHSRKDSTELLMNGVKGRATGATAMNAQSSRSHAIFTIKIKSIKTASGESTTAKFHMVDLAGSERSKKTQATGERFKEGVKINQGLLALGNVISALGGGTGGSGGFISYRDSKLTRLLQDSLGGNSVTLMIACVSPADYNVEETLSTLRYADRAKKIKNKPVVNEDSQQAEIKKLIDENHTLRMKLLEKTSGTPGVHNRSLADHVISPNNYCENNCQETICDMDTEIKRVELQLNVVTQSLTDNHYKTLLSDTFIGELIEKVNSFRDLVVKECPAEFATEGTTIFERITDRAKEIDEMVVKYHKSVSQAEDNSLLMMNETDDKNLEKKQREQTGIQIGMMSKILKIDQELKLKKTLLERKCQNTPLTSSDVDADKTIEEYELIVKKYENEIQELRSTSVAVSKDAKTSKIAEDRRKRVILLEGQITEMKKKAVLYEKAKRLQEQDRKRIEDLRVEIQEMKTLRVRLVRESRSETEIFKKWIATRDKQISHLKERERKAQNEKKRMGRLHDKQQAVLKRKVEDAKSVNKRLQDAMDRNRKVQAIRHSTKTTTAEKTEVIQTYVDHELQVLMSAVDAQLTLKSLMNDRGLLTERMGTLVSTVNKTENILSEIEQLKDDLAMRNAQISDLRQKIIQTDIETKVKTIPDNFGSVAEFKVAMHYLLRAIVDQRDDFTSTKTKAEDLKNAFEVGEERIEAMTDEIKKATEAYEREKGEIEHNYEEKLSLLCQRNINESADMEGNNREINVQLANRLQELRKRYTELESEMESLKATDGPRFRRKASVKNNTFEIQDLSSDDEEEFDFNDSFHDPDWVRSVAKPVGKKKNQSGTTSLLKESLVNCMDTTGLLANISETSDTSGNGSKRTSDGRIKCACKGSCATKLCSCKKVGNFCSAICKCSSLACANKPDDSKETSDDGAAGGNTRIKVEKENTSDEDEHTPSKNKTPDYSNITTPYYPYEAKKRRPLFHI
ncbi:unnamed protein product [Diamesa serratosioi]